MNEWQIYYAFEMVGDDLARYGFASQYTLLLNIHRDQKKRPKPYDLWETFPGFDNPRQPTPPGSGQRMSPDETVAMLETILMGAAPTDPPAA